MRVNTISMKLSLRIEAVDTKDGNIVMNGFAGAMPCETIVSPEEALQIMRQGMKLSVIKLLWKGLFSRSKASAGAAK